MSQPVWDGKRVITNICPNLIEKWGKCQKIRIAHISQREVALAAGRPVFCYCLIKPCITTTIRNALKNSTFSHIGKRLPPIHGKLFKLYCAITIHITNHICLHFHSALFVDYGVYTCIVFPLKCLLKAEMQ